MNGKLSALPWTKGTPSLKRPWACCAGAQRRVGETDGNAVTMVEGRWSVDQSGFTQENRNHVEWEGELNPETWLSQGGFAENTTHWAVQ